MKLFHIKVTEINYLGVQAEDEDEARACVDKLMGEDRAEEYTVEIEGVEELIDEDDVINAIANASDNYNDLKKMS